VRRLFYCSRVDKYQALVALCRILHIDCMFTLGGEYNSTTPGTGGKRGCCVQGVAMLEGSEY